MSEGLTDSEKIVYQLCQNTFLSLWSYVNPIGKKGKELCDVLIVCDPHVIVVSIKEIKFECSEENLSVKSKRWIKKAIEESNQQIYGAIRFLQQVDEISVKNRPPIVLPPKDKRIYHQIAVTFGNERTIPVLPFTLFDNSSITHVLDEKSAAIVLEHLSTISDFTEYLSWKEKVILASKSVILTGGEENLLPMYFSRFDFEETLDFLVIEDESWDQFLSSPQYQAKLQEDSIGYFWDELIESIIKGKGVNGIVPGTKESDFEPAVRHLAIENRFYRRILSKAMLEFIDDATNGKTRSRMICSQETLTCYVWLCNDKDTPQKERIKELYLRCCAAILRLSDQIKVSKVVGISTDIPSKASLEESAIEIMVLLTENDAWPEKIIADAKRAYQEHEYFVHPPFRRQTEDEFPE